MTISRLKTKSSALKIVFNSLLNDLAQKETSLQLQGIINIKKQILYIPYNRL